MFPIYPCSALFYTNRYTLVRQDWAQMDKLIAQAIRIPKFLQCKWNCKLKQLICVFLKGHIVTQEIECDKNRNNSQAGCWVGRLAFTVSIL